MASRIKRLVHRKKSGQHLPHENPAQDRESALSVSPYENAVAGNEPATGDYPMRGKTSSNFERAEPHYRRNEHSRERNFPKPPSRRSSRVIESTINLVRRTSSQPSTDRNRVSSAQSIPPPNTYAQPTPSHAMHSPHPTYYDTNARMDQSFRDGQAKTHQNRSRRMSGNHSPSPVYPDVNATVDPPSRDGLISGSQTRSRRSSGNYPPNPIYPDANAPGNQSSRDGHATTYQPRYKGLNGNWDSAEQTTPSHPSHSLKPVSPKGQSPDRHAGGEQARIQRSSEYRDNTEQEIPMDYPQSRKSVQPQVHAATNRTWQDGQAIIARAKSNSEDVDVDEHMAKAVTHETVHHHIHHVRDEQITRDIHTHDVFHRVLPVVDVEVLPARHFLPVEGGGLAEVSGEDVRARSHNWVIAETVSQIPTDQHAQTGRRQFSAREYPGREGDAKRYAAPEGHEKTEETWVHAPELETGARDTGQSWPLEIGDLSLYDKSTSQRQKEPISPKQKTKRKPVGDNKASSQSRTKPSKEIDIAQRRLV